MFRAALAASSQLLLSNLTCICLSVLLTSILKVLESYQELEIISSQQMKKYCLKLTLIHFHCVAFDLPRAETIYLRLDLFESEICYRYFCWSAKGQIQKCFRNARNQAKKYFHFYLLKLYGGTRGSSKLKFKVVRISGKLTRFKLGPKLICIFSQFLDFVWPILGPVNSRRHRNSFPCGIQALCSLRKRNPFCLTVVLIDANVHFAAFNAIYYVFKEKHRNHACSKRQLS